MICKRAWTKPGFDREGVLRDCRAVICARLEVVNLTLLRFCMINDLTLDEALALAKEEK